MNLQLNDPTLPPPGEIVSEEQPAPYRTASPQPIGSPMTGDPHHLHLRTPSLGEIHQELEQEQEAQVVRYFYECPYRICTSLDLRSRRKSASYGVMYCHRTRYGYYSTQHRDGLSA